MLILSHVSGKVPLCPWAFQFSLCSLRLSAHVLLLLLAELAILSFRLSSFHEHVILTNHTESVSVDGCSYLGNLQ